MSSDVLGKGSYGEVYKMNGQAIKVFKNKAHIIQEYAAGNYLNSCNYVVNVISADFDNLLLKMQLCDYSLRNWIDKYQNTPEYEKNLPKIIKDILYGINEIHALGLSHADIKPSNFLVINYPVFKVVAGDLGFVSNFKYAKVERTAPVYREINVSQTQSSDLYSIGITLLELIAKIKINRQAKYNEVINIITDKIKDQTYKDILLSLTNKDPSKRYSIEKIIKLLYNETHTLVKTIPNINDQSSIKYLFMEQKTFIRKSFKSFTFKYDIKRGKKGYIALIRYIEENQVDKSLFKIMIGATLFILSAVFGKTKFKEVNIKEITPDTTQLNSILNTLLSNNTYLNIIYSP
jgi:serine/threonine protein kinase